MDYRTCPNLVAMFFAEAARGGDRPFLWAKRAGHYQPVTWREARARVADLARALRALGIGPGDRVSLVAENRPEWMIADLAVMAAGGITVPGYTTGTVDDFRHLFSNSGARAVIVSTAALAQRVLPAADQVASVETVIALEPPSSGQLSNAELYLWDDLLARHGGPPEEVEAWAEAIGRDDIACLIYTSGTGGMPKGVMTTHANILANCRGAYRLLATMGLGDEVFLCFLPLSHSYEHTAGMMFPISMGAQIYFAEGAETLAANLLEARPTIMTAVPRLYETLHQRMLRGIERAGGLRARLFFLALRLGTARLENPHGLSFLDRQLDRIAERLVRRQVQGRFGGRLKAMVSGGGPLTPEIGTFFVALGVRLLQGYGQTEAAPVISVNPPSRIKIATVGVPLDGVEVRIAEDGEILVHGEQVMKGYWNDPDATARTLAGGWLHTGDIGTIDADGYISITDRKRDFIKNSGGEMISPARVEGQLVLQPEIGQAMVFGDRRPYLVAVIVPRGEFLEQLHRRESGEEDGLDAAAPAADPALRKAIAAAVARANAELPQIARVRRFLVADEPFTMQNGQMTPTLKIKRHAVREAYGDALAALYESRKGDGE